MQRHTSAPSGTFVTLDVNVPQYPYMCMYDLIMYILILWDHYTSFAMFSELVGSGGPVCTFA